MDTIGLYDPATGNFFLKNTNSAGSADLVFQFGGGGTRSFRSSATGTTTERTRRESTSQVNGTFFLRNANSAGAADLAFTFGAAAPTRSARRKLGRRGRATSIGFYDLGTGVSS